MAVEPWSSTAFEAKYRADPDPWNFAASTYEQGRYDAILRSLSRERYERAYEPGCSVGALTVRLGDRCDDLWAVDVSPTAIARAARRCGSQPSVHLAVGSVADDPPPRLDLVVFSEIGYYFTVAELDAIIERIAGRLGRGGELAACHWLGESTDHQLHGSVVHERLHHVLAGDFDAVRHDSTPDYVIDVWIRR